MNRDDRSASWCRSREDCRSCKVNGSDARKERFVDAEACDTGKGVEDAVGGSDELESVLDRQCHLHDYFHDCPAHLKSLACGSLSDLVAVVGFLSAAMGFLSSFTARTLMRLLRATVNVLR